MTSTNEKIRALFFAAIMVTSVFVTFIAFSGAAAAATINRGDTPTGGFSPQWDTADGSGEVGGNTTVYQGEESITFVDSSGSEVDPANLERTGGSAEGEPLSVPIPPDQARGSYDLNGPAEGTGGFRVTVDTPRITNFEVQNADGTDIAGGTLTSDNATVVVEYNYPTAEDIDLTITDESGTDVTGEVTGASSASVGNNGSSETVEFDIDVSNLDDGEDYTFTVEGTEDLTQDSASDSTTVTIADADDGTINLASDSVTQGENVEYTISGSEEGNYHVVTVEAGDFRSSVATTDVDNLGNTAADEVLRNVGDTSEVGVLFQDSDNNDNLTAAARGSTAIDPDDTIVRAYAVVEIDGGEGVGQINSEWLDTTSVGVDLHADEVDAGSVPENIDTQTGTLLNQVAEDIVDDTDLEVQEPDVSLDEGLSPYVVGEEVTVSGSASSGVDDVVVMARERTDWEVVELDDETTIDVDSDDTFEVEDVRLNDGDGGGNDILNLPGTYRIGVVGAESFVEENDAVGSVGNIGVDDTLSTSEFTSAISSSQSIRVVDTALEADFVTYRGQVSDDDNLIDVNGTAVGQQNVLAVFIDRRGNTVTETISVEENGTFEADDIDISALRNGPASAHVLSAARDGEWGEADGTIGSSTGDDAGDLASYADGLSGSGDQVRERLVAATVEADGSDDLIVSENFRISQSLTQISDVYPDGSPDADTVESGETMVIEGTTNRRADDNTITVELLTQEDDSIGLTGTEEWGQNGEWSVTLDTEDVEPGVYVVEADDGSSADRQEVEIVAERSTPTPTPTATPEPTPTATPEPTPTATPEPTPTATMEPTPTPTDTPGDSGPGFGVIVAILALLGAALLAARRNA